MICKQLGKQHGLPALLLPILSFSTEAMNFNYDTNPQGSRVYMLHLLKSCNVLVGCYEHVLPVLEAKDGPLLSFDMFDVLVCPSA